eukprot:6191036-Pleurochrysis_carterae.AAC.1
MPRCHWHASQASSQGVYACQTMAIQSSQPTTVAKKNEMMALKHRACMLGPGAQLVVHTVSQCSLGFARVSLAMVQSSRKVTLLPRELISASE